MKIDDLMVILDEIKKKKPSWKNRFLTLKVEKLKGPDVAIAKRYTIKIDESIVSKVNDTDVVKYLLGHEYGHIYHNHMILAVICTSILATFLFYFWSQLKILGLLLLIFGVILWFLIDFIEFQADDFVKNIYNEDTVIRGLLWVGGETETMNDKLRIKRLERMGWKK